MPSQACPPHRTILLAGLFSCATLRLCSSPGSSSSTQQCLPSGLWTALPLSAPHPSPAQRHLRPPPSPAGTRSPTALPPAAAVLRSWHLCWRWQRIIGWRRPVRSPSPAVTPTPPCLLNHVPKCHTHTFSEPLQGWGLPHCPGQPVPTPDHSFGKDIFPHLQSKPPLLLLAPLFLIQARMPLAFLATWACCWLMFSWLLTSTPMSFPAGQLSSHSSPSLYRCKGLL